MKTITVCEYIYYMYINQKMWVGGYNLYSMSIPVIDTAVYIAIVTQWRVKQFFVYN